MNLKHLDFPFKLDSKALSDNDDYFLFEGYASTFGNVDYGFDVVMPGAFKNSLASRTPKLLYQHDMMQPIGVIDSAIEDNQGLFIKGRLPKANTAAADIASLIKCGAIDSMSIGFMTKDYEIRDEKRFIKECDLYEISLVTFPMNNKAVITDSKSVDPGMDYPLADDEREWDDTAAVKRIKEFTESGDKPSDDYKKCFMYYDSAKKDDFTSYKMPFVDVIDGKLYAVPRAIYAISAAIKGARGGVNIPQEDKDQIKRKLNILYKKMDKTSPFDDEKSFRIFYVEDVEKICTKREFERCLRESGAFSVQAATVLASKFIEQRESANVKVESDQVVESIKQLLNKLKGE